MIGSLAASNSIGEEVKQTKPVYYHIHTTGVNNSLSQDTEDDEKSRGRTLCPACGKPSDRTRPTDVMIQGARIPSTMMSTIWGSGLIVASHRLLDRIPISIRKANLLLGAVFDGFGDRVEGWATVKVRRRVIIRGSRNAKTRVCARCGWRTYYAAGARYLYPPPREGLEIFESHLSGLVVTERLFSEMALVRGRGFGFERLAVLDSPRDGLGELEGL